MGAGHVNVKLVVQETTTEEWCRRCYCCRRACCVMKRFRVRNRHVHPRLARRVFLIKCIDWVGSSSV